MQSEYNNTLKFRTCMWRFVWHNGYPHRKLISASQVQILDKIAFILLCTNVLGKGINPSSYLNYETDWAL